MVRNQQILLYVVFCLRDFLFFLFVTKKFKVPCMNKFDPYYFGNNQNIFFNFLLTKKKNERKEKENRKRIKDPISQNDMFLVMQLNVTKE